MEHISDQNQRLMRLGAMASMSTAALLIAAKSAAYLMTGSVAMLGSLMDSGLDLVASIVTFLGVRLAANPPDDDHRFGHYKAEPLAALFQSAVMLGSVMFLAVESAARFFDPRPLSQEIWAIAVSVLAIALTLVLVTFQKWIVRKTRSTAIAADSLHYTGDLLLNLAVVVAVVAVSQGAPAWIDGLFGFIIAVHIGWHAWQIGRDSFDMLMDREFDIPDRERILELAMGNPEVIGVHELKTRRSGLKNFIQMEIVLDGHTPLRQAHLVATEVEATVGEAFPDTEIFIHMDPEHVVRGDQTMDEIAEPEAL